MKLGLLLLLPAFLAAQTAEEIMARVAENQDRAEDARASFVYHENLLVRMKRSNGKLAREEMRDYTVTPTPKGVKRHMVAFAGKYGANGKEYEFSKPGFEYQKMDLDAALAKGLADHFGHTTSRNKDGIAHDLFPLAGRKQKDYAFHLEGREQYKGRDVFHITFKPSGKKSAGIWAGEALIDVAEYQPVLVTTHQARGIPVAVKIIAGFDLSQMGFKVIYQKFDDGLWFPIHYGGELGVRGLFFYARKISIGAINSDFKRVRVDSEIAFDEEEPPAAP